MCYQRLFSNSTRYITAIILAALLFYNGTGTNLLQAQVVTTITPDATLPTNTEIQANGNIRNITAGTEIGSNLFHSFQDFSVGNGDTANFVAPGGIANILSRVTGTNVSNIFGQLRSDSSANLFFLNPNGVVFGPNSSLDIGGSFHVSTADYLRLGNGSDAGMFSAVNPQNDVLTSATPAAFGFLGPNVNSQGIAINGATLSVPIGNNLSVVGRDGGDLASLTDGVRIQGGSLTVQGGQLKLASVLSDLELTLDTLDPLPNINGDMNDQLGSITLSQVTGINTTGVGENGVAIKGGSLVLNEGARILSTGNLSGDNKGPSIFIDVDSLTVTNNSTITSLGGLSNPGGDILIEVDSALSLTSAGRIATSTIGSGKAGDISITGNSSAVLMRDLLTGIISGSQGMGGTGTITLDVGRMTLQNGATVGNLSTEAGSSNTVHITVADTLTIEGQPALGLPSGLVSFAINGTAGELVVNTPNLLLNGGGIGTPALLNTGTNSRAGNITLEVNMLNAMNGSIIDSSSGITGDGGDITIRGLRGQGTNATLVELDTLSVISAVTAGTGNGGDISVQTERLTVNDSVILSNTTGSGNAGDMRLQASESISISANSVQGAQSGLFANTLGEGNAGSIFVTTPLFEMNDGRVRSNTTGNGQASQIDFQVAQLTLSNGGQIDTGTQGNGKGGNLTINATNGITISGTSSDGFSSGLFNNSRESGDAGDTLSVTAPFLLMENGRIVTATVGDGNAGSIDIKVDTLELRDGAQIFSGIGSVENGQVVGTGGPGKGGRVVVDAANSILITGASSEGFSSGIFGNAQIGTGKGGDIQVFTETLNINGAGQIAALSGESSTGDAGDITIEVNQAVLSNGGTINSSTFGSGKGGTISLIAMDSTSVSGAGSRISATAARDGRGGDIQISTTKELAVRDGASIAANSLGQGDAGTVLIQSGDSIVVDDSSITTRADNASGGSIKLAAEDLILLLASRIESLVQGSVGTSAGDISIDPEFIVVQNSQILAQATQGAGGNIDLIGNTVLVDPFSTIDASSQFGISGSVNIQAPIQNLSGTIAPLPETIIETATLYGARCAAQKGSEFSSLNVRGRDRVPFEPGDYLLTPLRQNNTGTSLSDKTATTDMADRLRVPTFEPDAQSGSASVRSRTNSKGIWTSECDS